MFFFIVGDENGSIAATIPDKPVPLKNYIKLCDQRRKFPVLFKLEFQVKILIIIQTIYRPLNNSQMILWMHIYNRNQTDLNIFSIR